MAEIKVGVRDETTSTLKKMSGAWKDFKNLFEALKSPLKEVGTNFEKIGKGIELLTKNQNSLTGLKTFFTSFKDNKDSIKAVSEDLIKIQQTIQKIGTSNMQALASIIRGGSGPATGSTNVAPGQPGGGPPGNNQVPGGGSGSGQPPQAPTGQQYVQQPNGSWKLVSSQWGKVANAASNIASGIGTIGGAASSFGQLQREAFFIDQEQRGRIRSVQAGLMRRAVSGDMSDALAMTIMNRKGDNLGYATSSTASQLKAARITDMAGQQIAISANGAGEAIKNAGTGNIAGALGGVATGGMSLAELEIKRKGQYAQRSEDVADIERTKQQVLAMNQKQQIMLDVAQSQAGNILSLDRNLGGHGISGAWKGVGAGMDPGEMAGFVAQHRKYGSTMLMGKSGTVSTYKSKFAEKASVYNTLMENYGGMENAQNPLHEQLMGKEYAKGRDAIVTKSIKASSDLEKEQKERAKAGWDYNSTSREYTKREVGEESLIGASMAWQRKGISRDFAAQTIGDVAVRTDKDIKETRKMLEEAMAQGMKRGFTDATTQEAIGTAVAEGIVSGSPIAASDMGAFLTSSQFGTSGEAVKLTAGGLKSIQQANESDPYFKSYSMQYAREELGPTGSREAVLALNRGASQEEMDVLGVNPAQQKNLLEKKIRMNLANTKAGAALNEKYGGNLQAFLSDKEGAKLAAASLKNSPFSTSYKDADYQGLRNALNAFGGAKGNLDEKTAAALFGGQKDVGGLSLTIKSGEVKNIMDALTAGLKDPVVKDAAKAFGSMFEAASKVDPAKVDSATQVLASVQDFIDHVIETASKHNLITPIAQPNSSRPLKGSEPPPKNYSSMPKR